MISKHAALHFRGADLAEVVTSRKDATAYRVELIDGEIREIRLPARYLGRGSVAAGT